MGRFEDIQAGTRARRLVKFPLANTPGVLVSATPEQIDARNRDIARASASATAGPKEVPTHGECAVRVLSIGEHAEVYRLALARAKEHGATESEDSHVYNYSMQLYTVALGYVDQDSPLDAAKLYFGDTVEKAIETLCTSSLLSRDTLAMLAQWQETFQNECSPQSSPSHEQLLQCIEETVRDARFPLSLEPAAQLTFTHTMAVLLSSYLTDKSTPSSPSNSAPETSPSKPRPKPVQSRKNGRTSKRSRQSHACLSGCHPQR